jgi:hypothetical protein
MDRLRLPVFQERIGNDHDKYERTGAAVLDEQQFLRGESRTIAVTNPGDSALATEAYLALCACAEDSSLSGEGAAARLAQLGLVDTHCSWPWRKPTRPWPKRASAARFPPPGSIGRPGNKGPRQPRQGASAF